MFPLTWVTVWKLMHSSPMNAMFAPSKNSWKGTVNTSPWFSSTLKEAVWLITEALVIAGSTVVVIPMTDSPGVFPKWVYVLPALGLFRRTSAPRHSVSLWKAATANESVGAMPWDAFSAGALKRLYRS